MAIDRLEEALEDARSIPSWGVAIVVIVVLLCIIILLHVVALMLASPCIWVVYKRHRALSDGRLLAEDDIIDPYGGTELEAARETEALNQADKSTQG